MYLLFYCLNVLYYCLGDPRMSVELRIFLFYYLEDSFLIKNSLKQPITLETKGQENY